MTVSVDLVLRVRENIIYVHACVYCRGLALPAESSTVPVINTDVRASPRRVALLCVVIILD